MKALSLAAATYFAALTSPLHAQQVLRTVNGGTGDRLGAAAIDAGDQNGDGYTDLLVGAPGLNGGRGAVHCVSGRFLATGSLPSVLWAITGPPVNAGAAFGASLARVGNLTGNSAPDFVVGAPDYIPTGAFDIRGAVFLIDGSTHSIVTFIHGLPQTHFGAAIVSVGDQTGDFKTDIAVSAPDVSTSVSSIVHVVPGAAFGFSTALATIAHASHTGGWHEYGAALASGFDYDGDGKFDLAISIPNYGFSNPECGYVEVRRANDFGIIQAYAPGTTGELFGSSIDASSDIDGDGVIDLVVGCPGWNPGGGTQNGRVRVISGAQFVNPNLPGPPELYVLTLGFTSLLLDYHFGASVCATADLNGDGVEDIVAGAPGYGSFPSALGRGLVAVYSGATGEKIGQLAGSNQDVLGNALAIMPDLDGDGFREFVACGSLSDNPTTDCGVLKCVRLFPSAPAIYCTGKVNSLGCVPLMSSSGTASTSSSSPFLVTCANVINQKGGLLMYSHFPNAAAFQGGTLCVKPPLKRTGTQNSGGSASGADCTGTFSLDFNARIQSGLDPTLFVGSEVFGQYWSRDAGSPSTTSLSNAVRFLVNP